MEIAFIGAGSIAAKHRENIEAIPEVDITAVCDINEEAAIAAADPYDAEVYTDHEEMYDEEDIDAVFIVIPPFAHDDQEIQAAQRDIPVFVEKPVALSVEQAEQIYSYIADAGIVNQVGYVLRFSKLVERAQELVDPSEVSVVEGEYLYPGAPDSSWWGQRELSGGQVVEQSTHVFDTVQYMFGNVERVQAAGRRHTAEDIDFPDTTTAVLEHDTGVLSQVTSSIAAPEQQLSVRILGPDVDLTLDFIANHLTGTVNGESVDFESETDPFLTEIETFVEAVKADNPLLVERSSYREAIDTLALTLAATEAADTGAPVDL